MTSAKIEPQKPAEGVLKTSEWGDSKWYHIHCDCGSEDCAHTVNVEADDFGVQVHVYVRNHTKWWEKNRWRQIWQILTRGYADMETTIVMNEQTAVNYAAALNSAVEDVKEFKAEYWAKRKQDESST